MPACLPIVPPYCSRTASRPWMTPPVGSVSGASHTTSSAKIAPDPRQIAAPESFIGRACDRSVLGGWLMPPALHCALGERPRDSRADERKGRAAQARSRRRSTGAPAGSGRVRALGRARKTALTPKEVSIRSSAAVSLVATSREADERALVDPPGDWH